jgi:hypothetical protein
MCHLTSALPTVAFVTALCCVYTVYILSPRELRGKRCFDVAIVRFSRLRFYYCSPDTIYSTMNTDNHGKSPQPTTSDSNKAYAPHSTPDHGAVPRQSSPKSSSPLFVTGHRHPRDPPPSPARFLKKSEATGIGSRITGSPSSGPNTDFSTPFDHVASIDVHSITDPTLTSGSDLHTVGLHFREGSGNSQQASVTSM